MTLLTILDEAAARIGLQSIQSVVGNSDQTVRSLFSLANQEGRSLARRTSWQALTNAFTFTTVAANEQTNAIPEDFDWIVPDSIFNRTTRRRIAGPLNASEYQADQASLVVRVWDTFRIRGNSMLLSPAPPAGETIAYEYITKYWCQNAQGDGLTAFAADTDVPVLEEELVILGLVWRFKKARGMDYAEDFSTYESQVGEAMIRDGGKPRLDMGHGGADRVPHPPLVPETLVFP